MLRTRFSSQVRSRSFQRAQGFVNPQFDDFIARQNTVADPAARKELVFQAQRILAAELPVLPLFSPNRMQVYDRNAFEAWYFTPGCSPCSGSRNKHMFVTGKQAGF